MKHGESRKKEEKPAKRRLRRAAAAAALLVAAASHNYTIFLMHESYNETVYALEDILTWGEENGYTFRALDMTSPTCHFTVAN